MDESQLQEQLKKLLHDRHDQTNELSETLKTFHGEAAATYIQSMNQAVYLLAKQQEVASLVIDRIPDDETRTELHKVMAMMLQLAAIELGSASKLAVRHMAPDAVRNDEAKLSAWSDAAFKLGHQLLEQHRATEQGISALIRKFRPSSDD